MYNAEISKAKNELGLTKIMKKEPKVHKNMWMARINPRKPK